jgi:pyrroloquinoline quinone biosynthesis protein D
MRRHLELDDRPRLCRRARLRFDRQTETLMLLSPERGLLLNESAAAIVFSCRGSRTVRQIARELADGTTDLSTVEADVLELLNELLKRRLIELAQRRP